MDRAATVAETKQDRYRSVIPSVERLCLQGLARDQKLRNLTIKEGCLFSNFLSSLLNALSRTGNRQIYKRRCAKHRRGLNRGGGREVE